MFNQIGRVRVLSFISFCQIDRKEYETSLETLIEALQLNGDVLAEKEAIYGSYTSAQASGPNESAVMYLKRVEWILRYHVALGYYMSCQFEHAEEALLLCIDESSLGFVSDDVALGAQLYFLSLTLIQLKKYKEATVFLENCSKTHWVNIPRNNFLYTYTNAKLFQCQGVHGDAIKQFSEAIHSNPSSAYCYFRRGWSHKVSCCSYGNETSYN